jgi:hypothetical protein
MKLLRQILLGGIQTCILIVAAGSLQAQQIQTTGEPFALDNDARISLPLKINQNLNLSLGAVTESPAQAADEDKLAKQLNNSVAALISVPLQSNEDFGFGPSGNGYKYTLNIQPVIPISISKDWN